jgi:uncharacterized protein (TIGR03083 family)
MGTDRPDDAPRLWEYVETWHDACTDLVGLARDLTADEWHLPTDLPGWDVQDNVAHTAHLETVLAGGPEETGAAPPAPHVKSVIGAYTEQGVLARRGRTMAELADEIEHAVTQRYDALRADPPTDGSAAPVRTFAGVGWDTERLLRNRPLDVWMHDQDIRRATGRPRNFTTPAARHTIEYLADSLGLVVGKRVAPPAGTVVALEVTEVDVRRSVLVGDDGRARPTDPATDRASDPPSDPPSDRAPEARIVLTPETFVVLAGGRRTPDRVDAVVEGDRGLADRVLAALAVTP